MVSDDAILEALLNGTTDAEKFRHRDHIAAGLAALKRYEFFEATERYARALRTLVDKAGVPEKYNATVTLAFMSMIGEAHQRAPDATADELLRDCPELSDLAALRNRFSAGRLDHVYARRCPVLPDRA